MNHVVNFFAAIDWRIVAIAVAWLLYWRGADIAALLPTASRQRQRPENDASPETAAAVKPAEPADPIDRLIAELRSERAAIVAELDRLEARAADLNRQLDRIDAIFPDDETTIPERTY